MAIITVAVSDAGDQTTHWAIPPAEVLNMTPVPRGIRIYRGTAAVAALGAGDETNVNIAFTFPTVFNYQPKNLTVSFLSDDLTTEFSNFGTLQYDLRQNGIQFLTHYALECPGAAFREAVRSIQTYHPVGTWRTWINGPEQDFLRLFLADISGDASTAGDLEWRGEFWEYDIEQCLNWPVNTPQPTLTY